MRFDFDRECLTRDIMMGHVCRLVVATQYWKQNYKFYITPCVKCDFTHASRAKIRIFTPRDIKFRTILVRKTFS